VRVSGIENGLKTECWFFFARHPTIRGIFYPIEFLADFKGRKEARQAQRTVNPAPRGHHGILATGCGHQKQAAGLQNSGEPPHDFDITLALIRRDSVTAGDAHVFDRGTINCEVKMIFGEVDLEKVALLEFYLRMAPRKGLRLQIIRDDMKSFLCRQEAHVAELTAKFNGFTGAGGHFGTEKGPFNISLSANIYRRGRGGRGNEGALYAKHLPV
jgi:hypothetical protein